MDEKQEKRRKQFFTIVGAITFLALLVIVDVPGYIVETIGEDHAYIAVFLIAALGGVSSFTAFTYFSTIIAFAAAGLNPWWLGILGGAGVTIGDSLFFFFGQHSRIIISQRVEKAMAMVRKRLERFNQLSIPIFVFMYSAFTPFPNEFMTVSLGLTGVKYRWIGPPLLLGNIFITTATCLAVQYTVTIIG